MKCFSGVDVLNALLRKVTIMRVDKEGGDATEAFYNRESGPLATAAPIFTCYLYKGNLRQNARGFYKWKWGTWQSPFFAFSSSVTPCNQRRRRLTCLLT
jgi:hypothetical protein